MQHANFPAKQTIGKKFGRDLLQIYKFLAGPCYSETAYEVEDAENHLRSRHAEFWRPFLRVEFCDKREDYFVD